MKADEKDDEQSVEDGDESKTVSKGMIYSMAVLRRKIAEASMPLNDGPISVLELGTVQMVKPYYSQKKIYPVGYKTRATYHGPAGQAFAFLCGM